MSNLKEQLQGKISSKPSGWKKKARARLSRPWLKEYSAQIALRVLAAIEDRPDLSQAELARLLNVKPQQVHKIVKGQENLTLETIYKLSKALGIELIAFPEYKYDTPLSGMYGRQVKLKAVKAGQAPEDRVIGLARPAGMARKNGSAGAHSTTKTAIK